MQFGGARRRSEELLESSESGESSRDLVEVGERCSVNIDRQYFKFVSL